MIKKRIAAGLAVLGMASAPVVAQVASPAIAPVEGENELGDTAGIVAAALIAGIAAIAVLAIIDDDDEDEPVSP